MPTFGRFHDICTRVTLLIIYEEFACPRYGWRRDSYKAVQCTRASECWFVIRVSAIVEYNVILFIYFFTKSQRRKSTVYCINFIYILLISNTSSTALKKYCFKKSFEIPNGISAIIVYIPSLTPKTFTYISEFLWKKENKKFVRIFVRARSERGRESGKHITNIK